LVNNNKNKKRKKKKGGGYFEEGKSTQIFPAKIWREK
jgi:hypothetical protein